LRRIRVPRDCARPDPVGCASAGHGTEANEISATFAAAGVTPKGAAGSMIQTVSKLNCTLDPGVIKENSGARADCSLQTDQ
jgi:hypothetical protein